MSTEMTLPEPESASARLERSRQALRHAMNGGPANRAEAATDAPLAGLMRTLRDIPGGSAVLDVLGQWWERQPLRAGLQVVAGTVRDLAGPVAARSPLALVLGAMVAGAVLARLKPWRWLPRTLMFAGLLPQLATRVMSAVPLETWINAMTRREAPPRTSNPDASVGAGL